jgi:histidinol-phosphate aminotransferase
MENPYPMPEPLVDGWLKVLRNTPINRYPDAAGNIVVESLREAMNIPQSQSILLGNGSDELIQILAMAIGAGGTIMSPEPSFVMYRMIAKFVAMNYVELPLNADDFSLDKDVVLEKIQQAQPDIIFLAYPNNPTGNHWDRSTIEAIIKAAPGLVILDEAYEPFAADSFINDLNDFPNLLVMRTLSKLGMAGLRLGYLVGSHAWINELDKIRLPYNINTLTQASVSFALKHHKVFKEQAEKIKTDRQKLSKSLSEIPSIKVFSSDANFILFRTETNKATEIHQKLKAAGILIKKLDGSHPLLKDCLRVTVGTAEENQQFLVTTQRVVRMMGNCSDQS